MREEKTGRVEEMSDIEEQMGLLRDPQVPCVHVCILSLSLKKKTHFKASRNSRHTWNEV